MVLVAGRPAMGKSAYALNIVEHACIKNNVPTAIFTLEMGKDQIVSRLISEYAMIEGSKMKDGSFSEELGLTSKDEKLEQKFEKKK